MGHRPTASSSAYHVGKAGMWMFTQCLSEEVWEHNITVNELIPGPVATHLTGGRMRVGGPPPFAPSEVVKAPEDVVPLALFLATQPDGGTDRSNLQPDPSPDLERGLRRGHGLKLNQKSVQIAIGLQY